MGLETRAAATVPIASDQLAGGTTAVTAAPKRRRPKISLSTAHVEQFAPTRYHRAMNPDKPVHADNVPTREPRQQIAHEEIAARAQKIWQERGRPSGTDEAIWLEAETQLQGEAEARPVAGTPSRPLIDEPGRQLRSRTKVQDPAESAVQTRSATDSKSRKKTKEVRTQ